MFVQRLRFVGGGGGVFFFNDTATTEIYTLSLHDALPIYYSFWFAWSDFHPQTELYGDATG